MPSCMLFVMINYEFSLGGHMLRFKVHFVSTCRCDGRVSDEEETSSHDVTAHSSRPISALQPGAKVTNILALCIVIVMN